MKTKLLILLALPLLIALKCEKDPPTVDPPTPTPVDSLQLEIDKLPPVTNSGAGTIGCLLNGKAWIANSAGFGKYKYAADYYQGILSINANLYGYNPNTGNEKGTLEVFWFGTRNYLGTGTFQIDNKERGTGRFYDFVKDCNYGFDSEVTGSITITQLDTVTTGIVSGTFEFTTYKEGQTGCDTIRVTNGRFDVVL